MLNCIVDSEILAMWLLCLMINSVLLAVLVMKVRKNSCRPVKSNL